MSVTSASGRAAGAVYDCLAGALRGSAPEPDHPAFAAPLQLWRRALAIERCGPPLDRALRASPHRARYPGALRALLREESELALRRGLLVVPQLRDIARVATALGVPLLALKGCARLLGGEPPGMRSLTDLDLLAPAQGARALHAALQRELGYRAWPTAPPHHLSALVRDGSLSVELHLRLGAHAAPLDAAMWTEARVVDLGDGLVVHLPTPTRLLLHTLEHAAASQWALRYRLRDVLDIAGAFTSEVDTSAVAAHVHASAHRPAMRTLLAAAGDIEPRIPRQRRSGWPVVRRVGRTRLAAAARARDTRALQRVAMLAGVVAEASPRSLARLGALALRRPARIARVAAAVLSVGACGDGALGAARDVPPPPFLFVSDTLGRSQLFSYRAGTVTPLAPSAGNDSDPATAAGRLVFTSDRTGDAEVYLAALDASEARRLTAQSGWDGEPALDPAGRTVAFVSLRSGVPRLWLTDTLGSAATALETGAAAYVPERHPAWSPTGDRIAFTSTRTGTSQIFLVPAAGGHAVQLTRESGGAFDPAWSPDGARLYYVAAAGTPRLRAVRVADGWTTDYAAAPEALAQPACAGEACIAVQGALGLVYVARSLGAPTPLLARSASDRQPALLPY